MDVPVIEQARIQARVLVPIVKALEGELGAERAHALVRKALGDLYRRHGEEFWRSKTETDLGQRMASAFGTFARGDALDYHVLDQSPDAFEIDVDRCRYAEFYRELGEPELGFLLVCSADFRSPRDLVPTSSSRARRLSCKARATATFGIDEELQREADMAVRVEKSGAVWTVIHDRPEARNAMDPASADALTAAFLEFDADKQASVAVFYGAGGAFCAGWDLKYVSTLNAGNPLGELDIPVARPHGNGGDIPRGPLGPSRLELDKPVIAAIEGPAVAGGMELGLWCDFRVMAKESYFGVYCRRWGVPLIDGGTVRLPRIVGQGRALEIILTGRKVPAEECLNIGLCEYLTAKGGARAKAEELAQEIARFPQVCVRADRRSAIKSHGLSVREGLIQEWYNGRQALIEDGVAGAARFKGGLGRHGDFEKIR